MNRSISYYILHIYFIEYKGYYLRYEIRTGNKVAMYQSQKVHYQHTWK